MYHVFFGLKRAPFNVNPDPSFLVLTKANQEALACLAYAISNRKGFVQLTGEVGTGKTTLLNRLLDWLKMLQVATAFIFNSTLTSSEFLEFLMIDLGIQPTSESKAKRLLQLNDWLLGRHRQGQLTVLVVDEAQDCSVELLEEIRLLANLETSTEKLLQIVLCGQPELEDRLSKPEMKQLHQRITVRSRTQALSQSETHQYVSERLFRAGAVDPKIFSQESLDRVYELTTGIPRLINVLCEQALIHSFADQQSIVLPSVVDKAAEDCQLAEYQASRTVPESIEFPAKRKVAAYAQAFAGGDTSPWREGNR